MHERPRLGTLSSMPAVAPTLTRPNSQFLEVYNEGLVVTFCDAASIPAIEALYAANGLNVLDHEHCGSNEAVAAFALTGTMVAVELMQDDPVVVEVIVGPPPTTKEKRLVPMQDLVSAPLRLSTGELVLHSPNTAPWIQEKEEIEDQPDRVSLPPGDYIVTIAHVDFDELERRLDDEDFEWEGPTFYAFFTPAAEAKPIKKPWHFLPYPVRQVRALRRWSVRDGVVFGEIVRGSMLGITPVVTNIREDVAKEQGWSFGEVRTMRVHRDDIHLLLGGCEDLDVARAVFSESIEDLLTRYPGLYGGYFRDFSDSKNPLLTVGRLAPSQTADVGLEGQKLSLDDLVETVKPSVAESRPPTRREDALEATVLAVGSHVVLLECAPGDWPTANGADADLITASGLRRVRKAEDMSAALTEVTRFGLTKSEKNEAERLKLEKQHSRLFSKWFSTTDEAKAAVLNTELEEIRERIRILSIPDEVEEAGMPFVAFSCPHWNEARTIVQVRALLYGRGLDLPVKPGDRVLVRPR